ncbi:apicoplast RNA methyltransferase precursor, putative [Plasmodium ovale]|nr:apicoplast RNA methyltransferase precursor, putative [Plasmodium ovale]
MHGRAKGYEHALLTKSQRKDVPLNIRRNKFLDTQNENDVDYIYGLNSVCAVLKKNERELYTVMMNRSIKLDRKIHKHTYNYVLNTIRERNIKTIAMDKRQMDELVGGFPHNDIIMKGSYRYMQHYSSFVKNIDKMANFMSEMKQKGFTIYATCCRDSHTGNNFIELKNAQIGKNEKALIILGNESKGLCEDIIKNSDVCIYINNINNEEIVNTSSLTENSHLIMNSLNVNNVCAIVLYHFISLVP